jgi:hypothetical protein
MALGVKVKGSTSETKPGSSSMPTPASACDTRH